MNSKPNQSAAVLVLVNAIGKDIAARLKKTDKLL